MKIQLIKIYIKYWRVLFNIFTSIDYYLLLISKIIDDRVDNLVNFRNFFIKLSDSAFKREKYYLVTYIYDNDIEKYKKIEIPKAIKVFEDMDKVLESHYKKMNKNFLYWLWSKYDYFIIRIVLSIFIFLYIFNFIKSFVNK